jgi:hypothetical protein
MLTERPAPATTVGLVNPRVTSVLVRWLDPASGREIDANASLQDIVHDGIVIVRRRGPALPDCGQIVRIVLLTVDGPFVIHAKVARRIGPAAALVRPLTEARLVERRRWPRVTDPPVELRVQRPEGEPVTPRVLDLSVRGVRFEARVPFWSGERLSASLRWSGHQMETTVVIAAAVDLGNGAWVCRCRFETSDPALENELALLISELLPVKPLRVARLRLNRVPASATVILLGNWVEGDAFEIHLAELGASTMRFTSSRRLKLGTLLRVELVVDQPEPVMVEAEVIAVEEGAERWSYEARFRSLPEAVRRSILSSVVQFLITQRASEIPMMAPLSA